MADYLSHFFGIGIPAVLIFSCFSSYRQRALTAQGLRSSALREWMLQLFILCLFGLAGMVLWPGYHFEGSDGLWGNLVIHNARESWGSNMNLIPLRMVRDYLRAFREGDLFYAVVMFFGNLFTFSPLGFFPALLFREFGAKKTCLLGLGFSLGAECCQFFLGRHCDVDDVLLNVLGVMLGYGLYRLITRIFPQFSKKCQCQSQ